MALFSFIFAGFVVPVLLLYKKLVLERHNYVRRYLTVISAMYISEGSIWGSNLNIRVQSAQNDITIKFLKYK